MGRGARNLMLDCDMKANPGYIPLKVNVPRFTGNRKGPDEGCFCKASIISIILDFTVSSMTADVSGTSLTVYSNKASGAIKLGNIEIKYAFAKSIITSILSKQGQMQLVILKYHIRILFSCFCKI